MNLDIALQYNFDDLEVRALKLALLWEKTIMAEVPGYRTAKLPKGDPRKSILFRYCRKLAIETYGLLPDNEYKFYVLAQITTLKSISDGKVHAMIEPQCLCGPKAWIRWLMWKGKFNKQVKKISNAGDTSDIKAINTKINIELKRTRNFLETNFGKDYTNKEIKSAYDSGDLIKWLAFSKVSPYYIVLSPFIAQLSNNLEKDFSIDAEFYNKSVNEGVKTLFKEMFGNEV